VSSLSWGGDWPLYLSSVLQLNSVTTVAIRYNPSPPPTRIKKYTKLQFTLQRSDLFKMFLGLP
jgi:hypothetical protein